jgi:class 3 adenylate cyclase
METRNLAVMFTDIKGFTSKTAGFSRAQTQELLTRHRDLVLPVILKFSGRLVKTIGDAFMAAFNSPTDAVLCGVEVQAVLRAYNADKEQSGKIEIRIAINSGEVAIHDDGDIYGDAVNIASRLESITEAGEVFFTEAVYLAMNKKEVPSSEIGYRQFKGVAEKIKVYRVLREVPVGALGADASSAAPEREAPAVPVPVAAVAPCAGVRRRLSALLVDVVIFGALISALGLNSAPSFQWRRDTKVNADIIKSAHVGSDGVGFAKSTGGDPYATILGTVDLGPGGVYIKKPDGTIFPLNKRESIKILIWNQRTPKRTTRGGVFVKGEFDEFVYISRKQGVLTAELAHPDTGPRQTVTETKEIDLTGDENRGKGVPVKMLLWALYGALLIWRFGATPGKMILKLKVVDTATGEKPGADKAFLRAFFSLVSLTSLLGYAWALWEKDGRTWHDMIAGTRVLKT